MLKVKFNSSSSRAILLTSCRNSEVMEGIACRTSSKPSSMCVVSNLSIHAIVTMMSIHTHLLYFF